MKRTVIIVILFSLLLCVTSSSTQVIFENGDRPFAAADEPDFPNISGSPNITVLEGETGVWITWTANDTTPASYYIELDGVVVSYRPWDGSNISHCVDGLVDGVHRYTCVVIDAFNRSSADTITVTVLDNTQPIVSSPDDVFITLGSSVVVQWQVYDRNPSNWSLFIDDALQSAMTWTEDNQTISYATGGLLVDHKYSIRAVDKSGHYTEDTMFVHVDTQSPVITSPSDIEYLEGRAGVSIRWTVEEMFPYDHEVTRDGIPVFRGPWDGSDIVVDVSGLSEGVYYYELTVTDESGLSDTDTVMVAVLDGAAPIITPPDDITIKDTGQQQMVTLEWYVFDANPLWYNVTFDYYGPGYVLQSGPWDGSDILVQSLSVFSSGEYAFTLTLIDEQGYWTADQVFLIVVLDTQSPVIMSPSDIEYLEGTEGVSIRWVVEDLFPYSYEVTRNGSTVFQGPWDGSDIVVDVSGLSQGVYYYELNVTDEFGLFETDTVKVTVLDGATPVITSPNDITIRETGQVQTLNILWEVYDVNPYWYSVTFDYYGPGYLMESMPWDGSDILVQCWDNFGAGRYTFTLTLLDEQGYAAVDRVSLIVILDTQAPIITSPSDIEYLEGIENVSIRWVVEDLFPYSYEVTRNGSTVFRGPWDGSDIVVDVSGLSQGVYYYELNMTDESGLSGTDIVKVTVLDGSPPTVSSPDDVTIKSTGQLQTVFFLWRVSDANPYWYTVFLGRGAPFPIIDEGSWDGSDIYFQYDTYFDMGEYILTLSLLDEYGNSATDEVSIFVVAGWPSISSPFDVRYTQGEIPPPISWTISDSSPVEYTVSRNDTVIFGGSWDGDAVLIDISGLARGTYEYEIEAWNTDGLYISDLVTVRVDKDVASPVVDSPPDALFVVGSTGMSITWTCADLNPYSYDVSRNGTLILQIAWNSQEIAVSLDGLEAGGYEYELTLIDINGNTATDTVLVTVLPSGDPLPVDTGLSPAVTVPALLIAGAVCGALAVTMLYRRKD